MMACAAPHPAASAARYPQEFDGARCRSPHVCQHPAEAPPWTEGNPDNRPACRRAIPDSGYYPGLAIAIGGCSLPEMNLAASSFCRVSAPEAFVSRRPAAMVNSLLSHFVVSRPQPENARRFDGDAQCISRFAPAQVACWADRHSRRIRDRAFSSVQRQVKPAPAKRAERLV